MMKSQCNYFSDTNMYNSYIEKECDIFNFNFMVFRSCRNWTLIPLTYYNNIHIWWNHNVITSPIQTCIIHILKKNVIFLILISWFFVLVEIGHWYHWHIIILFTLWWNHNAITSPIQTCIIHILKNNPNFLF